MNRQRTAIALLFVLLLAALAGCQSKQPQTAPKEGVVYLDPNAAKAATAAPARPETTDGATAAPVQPAPQVPVQEPVPQEPATMEEVPELYYECRGVRIEPLMEAAPVLSALGEPLRRFEADSCAYVGKDVFYAYPGVQLTVNEVEGVERITAIMVTDDTVAIPQGLRIFDEEEKLLSILGGVDENGVYTYRHGRTELIVQVKDAGDGARRIAYMEYQAAADQ